MMNIAKLYYQAAKIIFLFIINCHNNPRAKLIASINSLNYLMKSYCISPYALSICLTSLCLTTSSPDK